MIYVCAFLFSGIVCGLSQVVLDNTKYTAGHITSFLTALGSFLSFIGVYPIIVKYAGGGANTVIMNFGHLLYQGGMDGFKSMGVLGIFANLLTRTSVVIVSAIVFSFIFLLFFKPKD